LPEWKVIDPQSLHLNTNQRNTAVEADHLKDGYKIKTGVSLSCDEEVEEEEEEKEEEVDEEEPEAAVVPS
jgi:hypothetical protein